MYENEKKELHDYRNAINTAQTAQTIGGALQGCPPTYRRSFREEAEKTAAHHREQAEKNERAAAFFATHPEFEEFLALVRTGAVSFY